MVGAHQMVTGTASVQAIERCSRSVSSEACMRVPAAARPSPGKAAAHAAAKAAAGRGGAWRAGGYGRLMVC